MLDKEKTLKKLRDIFSTIFKSIIVLLIIGIIMLCISVLGADIYKKDAYNRSYTGGFVYHEYLNSFYGLLGMNIYILINFFGFLLYNYITNKFKNYKIAIGNFLFIVFSIFINMLMLIIYFGLFGGYSFKNMLFDTLNNIIINCGWITFPIIFFGIYICSKKIREKI